MTSAWKDFWSSLGRPAGDGAPRRGPGGRVGLAIGALAIVAAMVALGVALLRTDYAVLFADLSDRDMAAMAGELDKQKQPYRVDERTHALLVPHEQVHKLRLKLMGSPVALNGAVGFELFNNADFAMTEFAQKINFQRALQGELTRTILSLDEVQNVRVHLALPEQGLFKKAGARAKASVTLQLKNGRTLAPEQVLGVQRLVAASVNDIQPADVAVLDQHGVVLSRAAGGDEGVAPAAGAGLDLKQGTEAYLARKATGVVERLLGAGEAMVSVDVELGQVQSKVTTEEVIAARGSGDAPAAGVIVRERTSSRDAAAASADKSAGYTTQETDYQTGKRTEQVVSPAGQLKRLHVAVVVRRALDDGQMERVRELAAAAVGLDRARGDVISVQSMALLAAPVSVPVSATVADAPPVDDAVAPIAAPRADGSGRPTALTLVAGAGLLAGGLLLTVLVMRRLRASGPGRAAAVLDVRQRDEVLARVQDWLSNEAAPLRGGER
ncbi:flagellar basal-body MS-ring/collar protein FliF [Rhizobacter sp. P5_C2]